MDAHRRPDKAQLSERKEPVAAVRRNRCGRVPHEFSRCCSERTKPVFQSGYRRAGTQWWASEARSTQKWMESQDAQETVIQSPAHHSLCHFPQGLQLGLLQPNSAAGGPALGLTLSAPCAEGKPATGKANSAKGPDPVSVLHHSLSLFRTLVLQRQPTNPCGNQYQALPGE